MGNPAHYRKLIGIFVAAMTGLGAYTLSKQMTQWNGWMVWSRGLVALTLASGIWAWSTRPHRNSTAHRLGAYVFRYLLLACTLIFGYLLLHEGGHATGAALFGRFDLSRSDFLGLHGTPHSGLNHQVSVRLWQRAIEAFGGPMGPTLTGWALFLWWRSRAGRQIRERRPNLDLFTSALAAFLVMPFAAVVPCYILGIASDGDWRGFIDNVPAPTWLVYPLLLLAAALCVAIMIIAGRHTRHLLRTEGKKARDYKAA